MTEQWDGRPENPERDGWHWVGGQETEKPVVLIWHAPTQNWVLGAIGLPPSIFAGANYLGPCLTPAEVEARVAAARAEVVELRDALNEIASGRYSNKMLLTDPPQDPAVVRARAALAKESRHE